MIRYALIAAVVVVAYLWYASRKVATGTMRPGYVAPSPWAALGQLLGGALAGGSRPTQPPAARPMADGIYSRMGQQSPITYGGVTVTSAEMADLQARERELTATGGGKYYGTDNFGTSDSNNGE